MSYQIGMDTLRLKGGPRLAHTEYCSDYALVRAVTGKDPIKDNEAWKEFFEAWDFDFQWVTNDGPTNWGDRGRVTDMGHAEFLENGSDRREAVTSPFTTAEEVLAFDAVAEYGLPDMDELVAFYDKTYKESQTANPDQVITGGYYKTIVSGAIETFGWDMLLEAAADRKRFEKVLDSFFRLTHHMVKAWAKTSVEVFIQHDDMVWTAGPFIRPDFYRSVIFPRYKELWKTLHEAGKTVLYCSDGNFTMFVDDIVEAGADGLIFEPLTELDGIVERYGKSHAIVGSKVDCRTLTFGTKDEIKAEIDATLALAMDCPGYMFAVGNHIPSNVPPENAIYYFDYLSKNWHR